MSTRTGKYIFLGLVASAIVTSGILFVDATPRGGNQYVQLTAQDDGDKADGFSTSCSSSVWTSFVTGYEGTRAVLVQSMLANSYGVCISTFSTVGIVCDNDTVGPELEPGGTLTTYGEQTRYCRARAGSVSGERIKGERSYVSLD